MQRCTLYAMFQETVRQYGSRHAVGFRAGKSEAYTYWTYAELAERVRQCRRGLDAMGFRKGDRIALMSSENRVEWAITDLAAQALGLITVPIYGTLPAQQVEYYIRDSGARGIVVSDARQAAKVAACRAATPELEYLVAMEADAAPGECGCVLAFEDVYRRGEQEGRADRVLEAIAESVDPEDIATVIYTSGTTGDPKGAMLSHVSLLQAADGILEEGLVKLVPEDVFLSFLPLSHITERVGGHYLPLRVGACIVYSMGLMSLADELKTVRPTAMLCVPRLYEMMHQRVRERVPKMTDRERKAFTWALRVGGEVVQRKAAGSGVGPALALQHKLADKLVLSKVREQMLGGRQRYLVSGGAPLDAETARFFLAVGIQLLEGYGLSEVGIISLNRPDRQHAGTVGTLMPEFHIKIAEDGEILARGRGRVLGYWNKSEATAEAVDSEGYFHTGDVGELTADGFLRITDRKKDLIVLTNGKKVAPQPIEATLKHSEFIAEAVLFGDRQPSIMALLVPAYDRLLAWARQQQLPTEDVPELVERPEVRKLFKAEIDKFTRNLADFEKIKRFALTTHPFSIETGELTPTLKVKRKFVAQRYADLIAAMSR